MKYYTQHEGRVIEMDGRFKHVMAIALDPTKNYKEGIIRCITNREGEVHTKGYTDRSELYKVAGNSLYNFKITERLNIKNETEITESLTPEGYEFIGLEDPDIWIDKNTELIHVYFTIPIIPKDKKIKGMIHLGHAVGKDLDSLEMTEPALISESDMSAKEISVAPLSKNGLRYNLIETKERNSGISYSIVQVAIAKDMNKPWERGEIVFHPKEHNIPWIGGHASPGPLFSKDFINMGEGKMLGIINGRESNTNMPDGTVKYGMFSVGLFVYDYENGKIEWVSPMPFIQDTEATTITFASQLIETRNSEAILYAHVDDSFVRAYDLKRDEVTQFLKDNNYEIKN